MNFGTSLSSRLNVGKLNLLGALLVTVGMVACTSEPKVTELSSGADPQTELDRVDSNIKDAQSHQVDVLSPKNFEMSRKEWNKAVEARAANKDQKDVLHRIALSQAYLNKANEVANVGTQILQAPLDARKDALAAKAPQFYPKEMSEADHSFRDLTEEVENNDTGGAEKKRDRLAAKYREIERNSIQQDKLGPAKNTIAEATKEGAKKLTPQTYASANKHFADDTAKIDANLHDSSMITTAAADATDAANRLLKLVREAKDSKNKNPEQLALQEEKAQMEVAQSDRALSEVENNLAQTKAAGAAKVGQLQSQNGDLQSQNGQLQSEVWLDREFASASQQFSPEEADVYKQGDKLLLRLKGLSFDNGKAVINSANFPLLAKVQKIIGEVGPSEVAIQGHTDSSGGKKLNAELSKKRAESVQAYFVANNSLPQDKITAEGYGDSKPIASNKTADGRKQNRRVDVIITAESTASDAQKTKPQPSGQPSAPQQQQ